MMRVVFTLRVKTMICVYSANATWLCGQDKRVSIAQEVKLHSVLALQIALLLHGLVEGRAQGYFSSRIRSMKMKMKRRAHLLSG